MRISRFSRWVPLVSVAGVLALGALFIGAATVGKAPAQPTDTHWLAPNIR